MLIVRVFVECDYGCVRNDVSFVIVLCFLGSVFVNVWKMWKSLGNILSFILMLVECVCLVKCIELLRRIFVLLIWSRIGGSLCRFV